MAEMSEKEQEVLLPVEEAARRLGISPRTLWRRIRKGEIRSVKVGRRRLIPHKEVERLKGEAPRPSSPSTEALARLNEFARLLEAIQRSFEEAKEREEERRKRLEFLAEEVRALREEMAHRAEEERKGRKILFLLLCLLLLAIVALAVFLLWRV